MRNLTVAEGLIKEHAAEPLDGHTVVVFERGGGSGERFHSVLAPGAEMPRKQAGKPGMTCCMKRPVRHTACAVDRSPERRLAFNERVRLDNGDEISLAFEMRYRVVDAKALAACRRTDPLEQVRAKVADEVVEGLSGLPGDEVRSDFGRAVDAVVERVLLWLNRFAAGYGIGILGIVVTANTCENGRAPRGKRAFSREFAWMGGTLPEVGQHTREVRSPGISETPPAVSGASGSVEWLGQGNMAFPADEVVGAVCRAKFQREMVQSTLADGRKSVAVACEVAAEALKGDPVDCTVFSPPRVQPGGSALVQVFVHLPLEEAEAKRLAMEFDAGTARRGFTSLEARLEEGARLTFRLDMAPLEVENPRAHLVWQGRTAAVQFSVKAPDECQEGAVNGKVAVRYEGVPIGHIRFTMEVCAAACDDRATLTGSARRYRKAFVSYASADRAEVLRRTQMLQALGIPYFQDVLDLKPGERWERELYRNIDDCDVFLLFWSKAARRSKWVLEEARYAMRRKGGDDDAPPHILPVIVGPPPAVKPPEDLAHLHFNDTLCYVMSAS